ncbi:MAG: T9SS type A sorting domain-containing protein, partial [Flavobacteriales bacterium]
TYSDTTQNSSGCDSISTLELVVTAVLRDTMQDTICSGSSIMLGTQVLTMAGTYSDTIQNASGCDSINTIELVVNTAPRDTITDTICQGASLVFGAQTLTMSGNYSDTAQTAAGCDSITVMELLVNDYIRDTIADTICANEPFMLGTQMLSITGTYSDTAQNSAGCDSITTLELVVDAISRDTIATTICSGASVMLGSNSYNATGFYSDTLQNTAGCDSISVLNLTVISYPVTMVSATACDTFTTVGGQMVNISGTFIDTLTASTGCDSIVSTAVIINYTTYAIDSATACGSYISPSGLLWTTSGTRFDTVQTAKGCDSIITFTLTIKANTSVTRNVSSCFSYTTPETGNVYTASGTYQDTAVNAFGCNFFITTNLTINVANAGTVSVSGITLTANQTGVTYKWADCDNNFSYILGDTARTFTPVRNGNYAVIVTTPEGCSDTSACTSINSVSLEEFEITSNNISIYPNPATDFITVDILSQNENEEVTIRLFDAIGKLVYTNEVNTENNKVVIDLEGLENGLYTVSVSNEFFITTKKISVVK